MSGPGGFQPSFRITHRITAGLTRIERARGFLEAARLSEDWLETMRSRAFVLEAHHTTHIEGTRLTLEQAERLLAGSSEHWRHICAKVCPTACDDLEGQAVGSCDNTIHGSIMSLRSGSPPPASAVRGVK